MSLISIRTWMILSSLLLIMAMPSVEAHGGPVLESKWSQRSPELDGYITAGEWSNPHPLRFYHIGFNTDTNRFFQRSDWDISTIVYLQNNNDFLFLGIDIIESYNSTEPARPSAGSGVLLYFDVGNDGVVTGRADLSYLIEFQDWTGTYDRRWSTGGNYVEVAPSSPIVSVGRYGASPNSEKDHWMFEFRIPLGLAPNEGGIGTPPGSSVGISMDIYGDVVTGYFYPDEPYNYGEAHPELWADLRLGSGFASTQIAQTSIQQSTSSQISSNMLQLTDPIVAFGALLVVAVAVIGSFVVRRRKTTQGGLFEVSTGVPSVGKTVTLEVATDHTLRSLVETLISTLNLPKDRAFAVECGGKLISQAEFGKSLGTFGIKEGSKLSLRVVE
jgi:hypothetical protein